MRCLKLLVDYYIQNIRPLAQEEINWFREMPSLEKAVEFAGLAINCKGKRYSHQCRLKRSVLEQARTILLCNLSNLQDIKNFDDLFKLIKSLLQPIYGIGELYIYDTSLRIGTKLDLFPEKVYLHTGTRKGARGLGINIRKEFLEIADLPIELHQLEPHEIEDVLCIFKNKLNPSMLKEANENILKCSWCG